jgi:acetyl-CoA carboxylase carboxyl transferase subunit alpha
MSSSLASIEAAIVELETQIERVKRLTREQGVNRDTEIFALEGEVRRLLAAAYSTLSPWEKTIVARNPRRPFALDYIRLIFSDFMELHGDRLTGDDGAMVGGIARLDDREVMVIGQQKGRDAAERHKRNFGYSGPEGYRKALRLMRLAEKFNRPILCFVDTPGADVSVRSEERGISEAIARNLHEMFRLKVPILVAIIGEGGSGGALGIGIGDRVIMLEHAVYSVIAPEGCAAILWKDPKKGDQAADALRLTAQHAREMGIIHEIVPEPLGGAHRDFDATARALGDSLRTQLASLLELPTPQLLDERYNHFRRLARFLDSSASPAPDSIQPESDSTG